MRSLGFESLEGRRVLAAIADILFVVDESESQGAGNCQTSVDPPAFEPCSGRALRPWLSHIVPELETKLTSRGIGDGTLKNRYGVLAFGDDTANSQYRALEVPNSNGELWDTANNFTTSFLGDQFTNLGDTELGLKALAEAVGIDESEYNLTPTDHDFASDYEFRSDAAVHIILVTDEQGRNPGQSFSFQKVVGPGEDDVDGSEFFLLLNEMRHEKIDTGEVLKPVSDAVLTTVADFQFVESRFSNSSTETIFGVDAGVLDHINLDKNSTPLSTGLGLEDLSDDVVTDDDDFVLFEFSPGTTNEVEADQRLGGDAANGTILDSDVTYDEIRDLLKYECESTVDGCPVVNGDLDQESMSADVYAYLTWELRGTAWDFDVLRTEFTGWSGDGESAASIEASKDNFTGIGDDDSKINLFNRAFVDDVFEKIRLQAADLAGSGHASLEGGFVAMWDAAAAINNATFQGEERLFDLDGDGNFFSNGQIDQDDILKLVLIYSTVVGDSDFDYDFDSGDFVVTIGAGEYEDSVDDNSTWATGDWDGNLDYNTSDFVFAVGQGGYENGVVDLDEDGIADYLPIWALDSALNGSDSFYRPDWDL